MTIGNQMHLHTQPVCWLKTLKEEFGAQIPTCLRYKMDTEDLISHLQSDCYLQLLIVYYYANLHPDLFNIFIPT